MDTVGRKVVELRIEDVLPNRFQPRIKFNEDAINELSKSIKEHGVIQPIVVRPIGDKFEIIAGERRYKASCMADLKTIPAIITDLNDKDSAEVALIENVQRENLTPIEEAISYKKILDMGYITQDALATKLGKTQSTVANKLRLLNLDDEVQEALLNEKISERHARSLLKLTDKAKQRELLNRIISERLTVRKTDDEINKILNGNQEEKTEEKLTEQQTKFINFPEIAEEPKDNINEQILEPIEETGSDESGEPKELSPARFFNILNEEEPKQEPKQEEKEPIFNFDNIFSEQSKSPIEKRALENNALLEELNEIEQSINNSNIIKSNVQQEKQEEPKEEPKSEIEDEELEFIEEFEEEPKEEKTTINEEKNKEENISGFKDALQLIRESSEKIEKAGLMVDTEEIDLENEYQIIIKIEK